MKYKLMCIDVDGTLVDSNKELPEENKIAIQEAYKAGVKIAIASGRSISAIKELLDELGIDGYGVCLNGAYVKYKDVEISKFIFKKEQIDMVRKIVEKHNVRAFFSALELNITNKEPSDQWLVAIQKSVARQRKLIVSTNENLKQNLEKYEDEILKVSIKEEDEELYKIVRLELEALGIFDVAKSDNHYIDVNVKGINKAKGVTDLAKYLDIDLSEVICIGDNENDIEMIKVAGLGIAVKNACKEVLEICNEVTVSNDECGVAKVIYDYILNK